MELGVAIASAVIAAVSFIFAGLAAARSQRSANAADRSASAAEGSLAIQRREARAAEEGRRRSELADLVPLSWKSRGDREQWGLMVRNNGPAVARDIVAYQQPKGGQVRKWQWSTMSAGETRGFSENEEAVTDEKELERIGRPPDEGADSYARLEWTNADERPGLADWKAIQHN